MKKIFIAIALLGIMSCKADDDSQDVQCGCIRKDYSIRTTDVNGTYFFGERTIISQKKTCEPSTGDNRPLAKPFVRAGLNETVYNYYYYVTCPNDN